MNSENDLRIDISLCNNRLYNLIFRNYPSVLKFCEDLGLHATVVGEYLNLKRSPLLKGGRAYRKTCQKIADHFFVDVVELFPLELYKIKERELSLEMRIEHLPFHECELLESKVDPYAEVVVCALKERIERVLATLTPREEKIIRMRFGLVDSGGEQTLEEIANDFDLTATRIRQIEAKALRKLRQPPRSRKLKDFVS